jgi:hypothetical protein
MKNKFTIVLLLLAACFWGCRKRLSTYSAHLPQVKTVSAVQQADGSVLVTGELLKKGEGDFNYVGFYVDTAPGRAINMNQKIVSELNGNKFQFTYSGIFTKFKKYYFGAFAACEDGYVIGELFPLTPNAIDSVDIPCTPALAKFEWEDPFNRVEDISSVVIDTSSYFEITAHSASSPIKLRFKKMPHSGSYNITSSVNVDSNQVYIKINSYVVNGIGVVYLRRTDTRTMEVTICRTSGYDNLHTVMGHFTTRFSFPIY